jgi:hypothetical protein
MSPTVTGAADVTLKSGWSRPGPQAPDRSAPGQERWPTDGKQTGLPHRGTSK